MDSPPKPSSLFAFRIFPAYVVVVVLAIAGNLWYAEGGPPYLMYAIKPGIMVSLAIWFWPWAWRAKTGVGRLMMLALLFSWLGDISLMGLGAGWFIIGLGAFFFAHLSYFFSFVILPGKGIGFLRRNPLWILAFIAYAALLLWLTLPYTGEMTKAVVLYAAMILMMAMMALNLRGKIGAMEAQTIFLGAVLFVVSDSLIALNRFGYSEFIPLARVWILASYGLAQYLIVAGVIRHIQGFSKELT